MNNQKVSGYNCQMSEYQRNLLEKILCNVLNMPKMREFLSSEPGDFQTNALEEVEALHDILKDMPQHEKDDPGATHGLCLQSD